MRLCPLSKFEQLTFGHLSSDPWIVVLCTPDSGQHEEGQVPVSGNT